MNWSRRVSVQCMTDFMGWAMDFDGEPLPKGRKAIVPREKPVYLEWVMNLSICETHSFLAVYTTLPVSHPRTLTCQGYHMSTKMHRGGSQFSFSRPQTSWCTIMSIHII